MTYNALIEGLCLIGNVDEAKKITRGKGLCIKGKSDEMKLLSI